MRKLKCECLCPCGLIFSTADNGIYQRFLLFFMKVCRFGRLVCGVFDNTPHPVMMFAVGWGPRGLFSFFTAADACFLVRVHWGDGSEPLSVLDLVYG